MAKQNPTSIGFVSSKRRLRSWRWLARMGMMWMMAGLIRLIKIIRLIEFIRFIKVISLIAVDANLLVGWQVSVVVI